MVSFNVADASLSGIRMADWRFACGFACVCALIILPDDSCEFEAWPLPRMISRIRIAAAGLPGHEVL